METRQLQFVGFSCDYINMKLLCLFFCFKGEEKLFLSFALSFLLLLTSFKVTVGKRGASFWKIPLVFFVSHLDAQPQISLYNCEMHEKPGGKTNTSLKVNAPSSPAAKLDWI